MDYTKQVREYCKKHSNELIDISMVKKSVFSNIPYKTLLKIFNRLEKEGMVVSVSKGLYSSGNETASDQKLLAEYTDNGKGMVVGYAMFNNIGLTVYQDDKIEIYTNAITSKQKNIGRFSLKKVDLEFTDGIIDLVSLLEILDVGFSMRGGDYLTYINAVEFLAKAYTDENFRKVRNTIRYKYSTIMKLEELLKRLGIKNSCLTIY